MNNIEFIDYISSNPGVREYYIFEAFVLNLLEREFSQLDKPFKRQAFEIAGPYNASAEVDAVAPEGIDKNNLPTLFEIKISRLPGSRFRELLLKLIAFAESGKYKQMILVSPQTEYQDRFERYKDFWEESVSNVKLIFWGKDKIIELMEKHSDYTKDLLSNINLFYLRETIKQETDWQSINNVHIQSLRKYYEHGRLSLFLGAGISIAAGLPTWDKLLHELLVNLVTKNLADEQGVRDDEIQSIVKRLIEKDEASSLMTARYIRRGLSSYEEFDSSIFLETITDIFYKSEPESSELLQEIAKLTLPLRSGPKVRSVITYNFDDLLEKELVKVGNLHKSVYWEGEQSNQNELPIYHVHGFLPESRDKYDELERASMVFSEEGYHHVFSEPYHWSNLVQLNTLRESICLFIGLSFTDPNLRRLLEISATNSNNVKHYAIMQRQQKKGFMFDNKTKKVRSRVKYVDQFLQTHHRIHEQILKELGVNTIWFSQFEEIPNIIRRIYTAEG